MFERLKVYWLAAHYFGEDSRRKDFSLVPSGDSGSIKIEHNHDDRGYVFFPVTNSSTGETEIDVPGLVEMERSYDRLYSKVGLTFFDKGAILAFNNSRGENQEAMS